MKKTNIFLYTVDKKVVFPYHEYSFSIQSNLYSPQLYDNLVGFVTKIDQNLEGQSGVEKIDGVSLYGSLLKIHRADIVGGYRIFEKTKLFTANYSGLTFARFKILKLARSEGRLLASIEIFSDDISKETEGILEKKKLVTNFKKQMKTFYECKMRPEEAVVLKSILDQQRSVNKMIFKAIEAIELPIINKLKFLQLQRHDARLEFLISALSQKTDNLKNLIDIEDKVRQQMIKSTKRSLLSYSGRSSGETVGDLQDKLNSKKLPDHVRDQINKEMKRMGDGHSSQSSVTQKYIETLLQIPWLESTEDVKDIAFAEKILREDHTGLAEVKERILQYLAVRFRNGNAKGNIICLHGPPGVGKTSISKSIARALGREFTRVSLGGMNDEAELRGHRRTYVAALPGVIVRALIKAKANNPVILLDEIQKMGRGYKGDPEHALLQILDPSQNSSFVDHYVGIPIDLSKIVFICTANSLELSTPLLNRLELIEVPGYTREEKVEIASNHLIPLQIKENGVDGLVEISDQGLREIIRHSNELGVRELQRNIAKICRKIARKGDKVLIDLHKVEDFLGKKPKKQLWGGIGVVNGLAWTQMGGKVLTVEAIQYRSSTQKIEVTGQLGDVMKQSVTIAFSWIKANLEGMTPLGHELSSLNTLQKSIYLDKISLHIHFPEGATKKDGPSAGVTIVACIASLLLKVPVRERLAMTGQITLSGKVLPVGGIREKCVAAIYEGIKHIIIPFDNVKDLDKIDSSLRSKVQFYPVKDLKEVLSAAFPGLLDRFPPKL